MPKKKQKPPISLKAAATELGRKGGLKGGKARAAKLTKEELSSQGSKAAKARWSQPRETHSGELSVGDLSISCYVLDDGQRVFSLRGLAKAIGMAESSSGVNLGSFLGTKSIKPYISNELALVLNEPIKFITKNGATAHGIKVELLPDICDAVLESRKLGTLLKRQQRIADYCEVLVRGFSRVGIIALVDEATGYQHTRASNAMVAVLESFIAKELAQWASTFPLEFYKELYRLHPSLNPADLGNKKPTFVAHITNLIVYERLAPNILQELQRKNPKNDAGHRPAKHHQWLTRQEGYPKLLFHLGHIIGLMNKSRNWDEFMRTLDRKLPRFRDNIVVKRAKKDSELHDHEDEGEVQLVLLPNTTW